jgi:hypothetical protein
MTAGESEVEEARASGVDAKHSPARTLATILGAPLAAGALSAGLALLLPGSRTWSTAIAVDAVTPLWVLLGCLLPLARSGLRAWLYCGLLALPLLAALVLRL